MDAITKNIIAFFIATIFIGIPFYISFELKTEKRSVVSKFILALGIICTVLEWVLIWYTSLGVLW